jgi:hypothetical protein
VGTLDEAVLPAPDSLLLIIGREPSALSGRFDVASLRSFETSAAVSGRGFDGGVAGYNSGRVDFVLLVVIVGLMVPILTFIAATTRLDAARREERFAAMRLVGATPGQVAALSAVESAGAGVLGALLGAASFHLLHPVLVSFLGGSFHPEDVSVGVGGLIATMVVVPVLAVCVSGLALRRVRISPLGVLRRARPRPPSGLRLLPLAAGLAELVFVLVHGIPSTSAGQERAFAPGFLLMLIGIVTAGPWLTMVTAKALARRSNSATSLLAVRRLSDNPHAAFRAVSGVVLAVFTSTVAFGIINTIVDSHTADLQRGGAGSTLYLQDYRTVDLTPAPPLARLRAIGGVRGVGVIRRVPQPSSTSVLGKETDPTVISCADLSAVPGVGRCATASFAATVSFDPGGAVIGRQNQSSLRWPAASVTPAQLARFPVETLLVATDGKIGTIEQVRTTLEQLYPGPEVPDPIGSWSPSLIEQEQQYRQLAYAVIVAGLAIAGCTLAVASVAGIVERRRPFSLLRLTGVSLANLRRVVLLESGLPLVSAVAASAGLALLAAQLFLRAQVKASLQPMTFGYYAALGAGLVLSLAVIGATLPLLGRTTGPETARNE